MNLQGANLGISTRHREGDLVAIGLGLGWGTASEEHSQRGLAALSERTAMLACLASPELAMSGLHVDSAIAAEWTRFWAVGHKDDLEKALSFAERIAHTDGLSLTILNLARDQLVRRLALRAEKPELVATDLLRRCWYGKDGLGSSSIADPSVFAQFTLDDIVAFRHAQQPRGLVAGFIGASGEQEFRERCMSIVCPPIHSSLLGTDLDHPRRSHDCRLTSTGQQHILIGFPGVGLDDPDLPLWTLMAYLLGGSGVSHLFREVRENLGLTYAISARLLTHCHGGILFIHASSTSVNAIPLVRAMVRSVGEFCSPRYRIKNLEIASHNLATMMTLRDEGIMTQLHSMITRTLVPTMISDSQDFVSKILATTKDELDDLRTRWLVASDAVIVGVGPIDSNLLHAAMVDEMVKIGLIQS